MEYEQSSAYLRPSVNDSEKQIYTVFLEWFIVAAHHRSLALVAFANSLNGEEMGSLSNLFLTSQHRVHRVRASSAQSAA